VEKLAGPEAGGDRDIHELPVDFDGQLIPTVDALGDNDLDQAMICHGAQPLQLVHRALHENRMN
jgi:hypothetical protein